MKHVLPTVHVNKKIEHSKTGNALMEAPFSLSPIPKIAEVLNERNL